MPFSTSDPNDYLAIGRQSAAGAEATSFKFLRYTQGVIPVETAESQVLYEGGGGQDPTLVYATKRKPDGDFGAYARPDQFTYLGAWAMGQGTAASAPNLGGGGSHLYFPS